MSLGELAAILATVAQCGEATYQGYQAQVRGSPVVQADETLWREDGHNGYVWSFSTPTVRYVLYRHSRGSQVVTEVLGEPFQGVLASDFDSAYNVHLGEHQRCLVHLLRDLKTLQET